jgi:hypothetical protein
LSLVDPVETDPLEVTQENREFLCMKELPKSAADCINQYLMEKEGAILKEALGEKFLNQSVVPRIQDSGIVKGNLDEEIKTLL